MSKLAKEAAGMCNDFVAALEALKCKVLGACPESMRVDLGLDFADLRTRAIQIKAQVPAACVCAETREPKTLAEVQQERETQRLKPVIPDHKMKAANDDTFALIS